MHYYADSFIENHQNIYTYFSEQTKVFFTIQYFLGFFNYFERILAGSYIVVIEHEREKPRT